eukprot:3829271-Pyramimonas_sp.AAC.1
MKDNKGWSGALAPILSNRAEFKHFEDTLGCDLGDKINDPGASSWLATCRKNQKRFGCQAWPLPGVATFVQAISAPGMYIALIPMKAILAEGIVFANFEKFIESPQGVKFMQGSSNVVYLPKGAI